MLVLLYLTLCACFLCNKDLLQIKKLFLFLSLEIFVVFCFIFISLEGLNLYLLSNILQTAVFITIYDYKADLWEKITTNTIVIFLLADTIFCYFALDVTYFWIDYLNPTKLFILCTWIFAVVSESPDEDDNLSERLMILMCCYFVLSNASGL